MVAVTTREKQAKESGNLCTMRTVFFERKIEITNIWNTKKQYKERKDRFLSFKFMSLLKTLTCHTCEIIMHISRKMVLFVQVSI